jgi:hypothetical protein
LYRPCSPTAANILLSRHGTAKICDIGMARVLGNKEYLSMLSGMGTFAWRWAPQRQRACAGPGLVVG